MYSVAEIQQRMHPIFAAHPEAGFVYLFGSRATKTAGPLSDYDFIEPRILNEYFDFRHLLKKYHLTKS